MADITIVIPFRNRDAQRVVNAWCSVKKNSKLVMQCIVSDYGSEANILDELEKASIKHNFKLIKSSGQGLPFNKARAVNIGVRFVETEYVCILDADMIIHDGIFDHVANSLTENKVFFVETHWPQSRRSNPKKGRIHLSYGVFQVQHKKWFDILDGYNEEFEFWGGEDSDWARRLAGSGAEFQILRATDFTVTHAWHPQENTTIRRPKNLVWKAIEIEMKSAISHSMTSDWGRLISLQDRPILTDFKEVTVTIDLEKMSIIDDIIKIDQQVRKGGHVCFKLGRRLEKRKLSNLAFLLAPFTRIFEVFGFEIHRITTLNLEYLIIALSLWRNNLMDRYILDDYSEFHVLFSPRVTE